MAAKARELREHERLFRHTTESSVDFGEDSAYTKTIPNDYSKYQWLDENSREIRLLRILPAVSQHQDRDSSGSPAPLVCYLVHTRLSEAPAFDALSYCWGDIGQTDSIKLIFLDQNVSSSIGQLQIAALDQRALATTTMSDGKIDNFQITENLHETLLSLRQNQGAGFLWIDMLSINQGNTVERSHQVGWMAEIYAKASRVIVSLGGDPHVPSNLLVEENEDLAMMWQAILTRSGDISSLQKPWADLSGSMLDDEGSGKKYLADWNAAGVNLEQLQNLDALQQHEVGDLNLTQIGLLMLWMYHPFLKDGSDKSQQDVTQLISRVKATVLFPGSIPWQFAALQIQGKLPKHALVNVEKDIWPVLQRLSTLASHDWFRRVWVLQEVASNENVIIRHASDQQSWRTVLMAYKCGFRTIRVLSWIQNYNRKHMLNNLVSRRKAMPGIWSELPSTIENDVSFPYLLYRTRNFAATDPRDKIFALIGLAKEFRSSFFFADYRLDAETTFIRFTRWLMHQHKSTGMLRFADHGYYRGYTERHKWLPSWVPDYCHVQYKVSGSMGTNFIPQPAPWGPPQRIYATRSPRCLRVEGTLVNRLQYVSEFVFSTFQAVLHTNQFRGRYKWSDKGQVAAIPAAWTDLRRQFYTMFPRPKVSQDDFDLKRQRRLSIHSYIRAIVALLADEGHALAEQTRSTRTFAASWALTDNLDSDLLDWMDAYDLKRAIAGWDGEQQRIEANTFHFQVGKLMYSRRLFLSADGAIGLCPHSAQAGDLVVAIHGGRVPVVLRESTLTGLLLGEDMRRRPRYKFMGMCFLNGQMNGEVFQKPSLNDVLREDAFCDHRLSGSLVPLTRGLYSTNLYDIR